MKIRESLPADSEDIRQTYIQAFDESEAQVVSDLAVSLMNRKTQDRVISLVALHDGRIVGHVAFSPVLLRSSRELVGYILAPLAVLPARQKQGIGASLVRYGLDEITETGVPVVFVYGDPRYYARFGFETGLAKKYTPPYTLQYPEGWQAMLMHANASPEGGVIECVSPLNDRLLW